MKKSMAGSGRRMCPAPALLWTAAVLCMLLLGGCAGERRADDVGRRALAYYRDKYGPGSVTVADAYKAGNSGLFGYLDVKDLAIEMSDGNTVYWDDSAGTFADNAQAEEILTDFAREVLDPMLARFSFPYRYTAPSLGRTGYESFDECVFTERYDGDIRAFLEKERPALSGLTIALETEDREACEQEVTSFYDAMKDCVAGRSDVFILSGGLAGLAGDDWYPDDHALNVTARARLDYEGQISWYRQAYIEIFEGICVTSAEQDLVFEDGDIVFEEAGTCAQLQQMLDGGYEALPVDAEENRSGGYNVKDRRHEKRVVLDDPEAPCYRLRMSQRVLDALDDRGCISVFFIDRRDGGMPLMMYCGRDSSAPYNVFSVRFSEGRGEYAELSPEYLYYFGTHRLLGYGEAD